MAKILTTAIVADIRNKLNGSVFSKNRYGSYVRTKVTPVNPQTIYQQAARNNLATSSQSWRGLSDPQRQSFIDGAINFPQTDIFGNTKVLSGQALYVKLNTNIANLGGAPLTACPMPVALATLNSLVLTATQTGAVVSLEYGTTGANADQFIVVEATPLISSGRSFVKNQFRFLDSVASNTASPFVLTAPYAARFTAPISNFKIFIRARIVDINTGQSGIPLTTVSEVGG